MAHSGLPQWLAEQTGLFGNTPEAVRLVIWINSSGGDLLAAIESINLMKASSVPIITIINGSAESAALLIATAGHKRWSMANSWGMAHHFSTGMEGSYHQIRDSIKHNEILHSTMVQIFKEGSALSEEAIEETLLGRQDTWLTPEDLLSHGLIDEIIPSGEDLRTRILSYGKKEKASEDTKQVRGRRTRSTKQDEHTV